MSRSTPRRAKPADEHKEVNALAGLSMKTYDGRHRREDWEAQLAWYATAQLPNVANLAPRLDRDGRV